MRFGGLVLFTASLSFGLGAEYALGETWLSQNAFWLMIAGCLLGLAWAVYDFWPRAVQFSRSRMWLGQEDAARLFRDESERRGQLDVCRMFDDAAARSDRSSPLPDAFHGWMLDGINRGQIQAWGRPINGKAHVRVKPPLREDPLSYALGDGTGCVVENEDGLRYTDLQFKRSSIKGYVLWLTTDD